jgi:hypothetical protein
MIAFLSPSYRYYSVLEEYNVNTLKWRAGKENRMGHLAQEQAILQQTQQIKQTGTQKVREVLQTEAPQTDEGKKPVVFTDFAAI